MHQTIDETKLSDNDTEEKYKHLFRPIWANSPPENLDGFPSITLCGIKQKPKGLLRGIEEARSNTTCPDCLMKLESYNRV